MTYKHEGYTAAIKKAAKLLDDPNLKGPAQIELERRLAQSETSPLAENDVSMIKQLDEVVLAEKERIVKLAYGGLAFANRHGVGDLREHYKVLTSEDINPDTAAYNLAQEFTGKILSALGSGRGAGK